MVLHGLGGAGHFSARGRLSYDLGFSFLPCTQQGTEVSGCRVGEPTAGQATEGTYPEEGQQGNTSHLDDLETDTRDITDGVARPTETGDQNLIVLVQEVQATVLQAIEPGGGR